ncbi:MAG: hypothetical protein US49_C0006G0206 [candidate division TM6 bacterium GW2011_GWF2_37_49]|nr:MAG: hypothetical protein US49_C0006G0206 [candidate division TM6 bacterium GW2011_GWF2_37_49]
MSKRLKLLFITAFFVNFFVQGDVGNLKDSLTILKPNYFRYSIIHGSL